MKPLVCSRQIRTAGRITTMSDSPNAVSNNQKYLILSIRIQQNIPCRKSASGRTCVETGSRIYQENPDGQSERGERKASTAAHPTAQIVQVILVFVWSCGRAYGAKFISRERFCLYCELPVVPVEPWYRGIRAS
eukprot:scaffold3676_cov166-Amphora_coffeaeformis.AAC.8